MILKFYSKKNAEHHQGKRDVFTEPALFLNEMVNMQCDDPSAVEMELEPGDATRYNITWVPFRSDSGLVRYIWIYGDTPDRVLVLENEEYDHRYIIEHCKGINPYTAALIAELHHHTVEEFTGIDPEDYEPVYYDLRTAKPINL